MTKARLHVVTLGVSDFARSVRFYQDLAPRLAQTHGLTYPAGLEPVFQARLEHLSRI